MYGLHLLTCKVIFCWCDVSVLWFERRMDPPTLIRSHSLVVREPEILMQCTWSWLPWHDEMRGSRTLQGMSNIIIDRKGLDLPDISKTLDWNETCSTWSWPWVTQHTRRAGLALPSLSFCIYLTLYEASSYASLNTETTLINHHCHALTDNIRKSASLDTNLLVFSRLLNKPLATWFYLLSYQKPNMYNPTYGLPGERNENS